MATLSEKEAEKIVKDLLPVIRKKITSGESATIRMAGIAEAFDPVFREGNTYDVYCKIARAAFEHGLSTAIKASMYHGTVLTFDTAKPGYEKLSPKICEEKWRTAKKYYELLRNKYGEESPPIFPPYELKK